MTPPKVRKMRSDSTDRKRAPEARERTLERKQQRRLKAARQS